MSPTPPNAAALLNAAHDDAVEVVQHCWHVLKYCQDREMPSLAAGQFMELQRTLERARGSAAAAAPLLRAARRARDRDGPVSFIKGLAAASATELAVLFGDRLWAAVWNAANFHSLRAGGAAPDFGTNLPVRDRHERERAYLVKHAVGTGGGCPGWMDVIAKEWPALFDLSGWEFELGWERTEAARQHAADDAAGRGGRRRRGGRPRLEESSPLKFQIYQRIRQEHQPGKQYVETVKRLKADKQFVEQVTEAGLKLGTRLVRAALTAFARRKGN